MTEHSYTHIVDLAKEVEPPEDGILTRPLFNDDHVKAVIFGFGQGGRTVGAHGFDARHSAPHPR